MFYVVVVVVVVVAVVVLVLVMVVVVVIISSGCQYEMLLVSVNCQAGILSTKYT